MQPTGQATSAERTAKEWLVAQNIMRGSESDAGAWRVAQDILNGAGSDKKRGELYGALCRAGDGSACIMAGVTARAMH
jgi:hypothetical protein